jgi:membrane-bound lytic murein transglycosylase B
MHFLLSLLLLQAWATPALIAKWTVAQARLQHAGLSASFVRQLGKHYDSQDFKEVVELNTLLFLRKEDYHGVQVTDDAVDAVRKFITENQDAMNEAEDHYHVNPAVIASLLWMESRHGKNQGEFDVPSVYVDLLQTDRPDVLHHLYQAAHRFTAKVSAKDRRDIRSRAHKRVKWALNELKAIQKMYRKNPKLFADFHGSFAGAFGMPQFVPSSYVTYAAARGEPHPPHLTQADDAIFSVANYLKLSGWRESRPKSHTRALLKYNNSHDYAAAILKLAKEAADKKDPREPAGR